MVRPEKDSEEEFQYYMDALQTVLHLAPGQALTEDQVAEIQFVSEFDQRESEKATYAHARGFAEGREDAAGKNFAGVMVQLDTAKTKLAVEKALRKFDRINAAALADEIATLKARVAELEADDATPYREALGQIVHLLAEERALNGGGPNFRARWTKALDEAEELMRVEP